MKLQQQIRSRFLVFLKHYFNPLTRRLARSSHGPFAIVQHVGRRSGKHYETPIIVRPADDGFVMELTYGPEVDWYKNVQAAGGCTLLWHGKPYVIDGIEPLAPETGMAAFVLWQRLILRAIKKQDFFKLMLQQREKIASSA